MANARIHNDIVARRLVAKIQLLAQRATGRGIGTLIPFLVARVRETVSVPGNPRVRAKRGAPPRKITGHLLRNVFGQKWGENKIVLGSRARAKAGGKYAWGFNYPYFHEVRQSPKSGLHPFVKPTVRRHQPEMRRIMKGTVVQVGYGFGVGVRRK